MENARELEDKIQTNKSSDDHERANQPWPKNIDIPLLKISSPALVQCEQRRKAMINISTDQSNKYTGSTVLISCSEKPIEFFGHR
jgi:hypothetical protein